MFLYFIIYFMNLLLCPFIITYICSFVIYISYTYIGTQPHTQSLKRIPIPTRMVFGLISLNKQESFFLFRSPSVGSRPHCRSTTVVPRSQEERQGRRFKPKVGILPLPGFTDGSEIDKGRSVVFSFSSRVGNENSSKWGPECCCERKQSGDQWTSVGLRFLRVFI